MALASLLGIPASALADWLLNDQPFAPFTIAGITLVCVGVLYMNGVQVLVAAAETDLEEVSRAQSSSSASTAELQPHRRHDVSYE